MTDLFPISKCTIPELCFDFGGKKKKKYDLNENTSINSGKVNILSGAGEECGRLFQKLNYLSRLLGCGTFWNCLINTLS